MLIPRKKGHQKNMEKINNQLVGFKILAVAAIVCLQNLLYEGAANLRSAPGGKPSSYQWRRMSAAWGGS